MFQCLVPVLNMQSISDQFLQEILCSAIHSFCVGCDDSILFFNSYESASVSVRNV